MQTFKLFLSTVVVCFCLDMVWLGLIAKNLYDSSIGNLLRKSNNVLSPNWPAAILVYFAIVIGILFFVLPRIGHSYAMGIFLGALLGLVIYGVYDFTNYAILVNWPLKITLIDCVWGVVLCALTTCCALFMRDRWFF